MIKKIISGNKTGAEQAARDVATQLGIPHDGWTSKGRTAENKTRPGKDISSETPSPGFSQQPEMNVLGSDGTLVISHEKLSGDPAITFEFAGHHKKARLHINLNINRGFSAAQLIKSWIAIHNIDVLNVAGPCARSDPEIYEDTVRLLKAVYHLFFIEEKTSAPNNLKPLYPRTVEAAVDRLFFELSFKNKARIAKLKSHELEELHPTLGQYIREEYGLRFKAGELIKDCRFAAKDRNLDVDAAAVLIIKALWKKLRKTHALRVVR